jgi:hypothetical protein
MHQQAGAINDSKVSAKVRTSRLYHECMSRNAKDAVMGLKSVALDSWEHFAGSVQIIQFLKTSWILKDRSRHFCTYVLKFFWRRGVSGGRKARGYPPRIDPARFFCRLG